MVPLLLLLLLLPASPQVQTAALKISGDVSTPLTLTASEHRKDGEPLAGNAAPFQLIMTGEKRPARWVRQVVSIEIVRPAR